MGIGEVGELLRRSTVHIRITGPGRQGAGSGVIWDAAGTIVTNAHVLGNGTPLVELWDGRSLPAEVQAADNPSGDFLAKLKLPAVGLPAATLRDSPVRPGELVVAVGNPLGFTGALTTGVVHAVGPFSGLGRKPWVQAAIRLAPGNSGGPLADAAGHVIGINTMIVSGGIALAVPSATVDEFVRNGAGPPLGVTVRPVRLHRRSGLGLLILGIDQGSLAEQASLLIGDLLIGTEKAGFTDAGDLADALAEAGSGRLTLRFLRGKHSREREVVVSLAEPVHPGGCLILVWIETDSRIARAGFESVLEGHTGIELLASPAHAEVVLRDELPRGPEESGVPTVVLSDEPFASRLFRWGVHAILPRDAPVEQIVAATLQAASAGLIAIPADAATLMVPAASESGKLKSLRLPGKWRPWKCWPKEPSTAISRSPPACIFPSTPQNSMYPTLILGKLGAGTRTEAVMRGSAHRIAESVAFRIYRCPPCQPILNGVE